MCRDQPAENRERAALSPHDEYAAFAKMADTGLGTATIAQHFGVTVRYVEQLLRLGNLAPPVFEAFASGQISEGEARRFASTGDTELQAKAFAAYMSKPDWQRYPHDITNLIRGDGSNLLGKLRAVGMDAYTVAGGRFDADLFGRDEFEGRVVDPDILETLFAEKEAAALAVLKATMPEVELVDGVQWNTGQKVDVERGELEGVLKIEAERLTSEIAAKRTALAEMCDEDGNLNEEADEANAELLNDEIETLEEKLDALKEQAPMVLPAPADGCKFVASPQFVPSEGRWTSTAVMMVSEDWSPDAPARSMPGASPQAAHRSAPEKPTGGPAFMKAEYGLSQESIEVMRGHRLMILQAAMMNEGAYGQPRDFLAFATIRNIDGGDPMYRLGLVGQMSSDHFATDRPEITGQPGFRAVSQRIEQMERGWLVETDVARAWAMFLDLDEIERQEWTAYASTLILARSLNAPGFGCAMHDAIASELMVPLNVRDHWAPDAAFWARLSKKHRLAALKSIDPELEKVSKALDNDMLIERCVGVFSGDQAMIAKLIPEGRAGRAAMAAKAWVPEYLQFRDTRPSQSLDSAPVRAVDIDVSVLELGGQDLGDAGPADQIPEAAE
jgi:hypothetical protein